MGGNLVMLDLAMLKECGASYDADSARRSARRSPLPGAAQMLTAECAAEQHDVCDGTAGKVECSCACHAACTCHHGTGCILHPAPEDHQP